MEISREIKNEFQHMSTEESMGEIVIYNKRRISEVEELQLAAMEKIRQAYFHTPNLLEYFQI